MAAQLDVVPSQGISELASLEAQLLLEGVYQFYGDDLRGYNRAALQSRLVGFLLQHGYETISELQGKLLRDKKVRDALLLGLCSQPVALFEHPTQFAGIREVAGSLLRSYPSPRIWIAECSSPSDVFAMAILLKELGVHEKTHIYATASSEALLQQAQEGSFPLKEASAYEANYRASGGEENFSSYWLPAKKQGRFSETLWERITWAQHSLVTDSSFNEFQLIVCRHPMRDFAPVLKQRVLSLFNDSLVHFGILAMDPELRLEPVPLASHFREFPDHAGLYRHIR